jgi:serine/threonine protein phosphatase 1
VSLIAIGDVHGCARTLRLLLERLALTPQDHVVFVGDYVDRGPDSRGVIQTCLDLAGRISCTFLRGNHEALMLDAIAPDAPVDAVAHWHQSGGGATRDSYPGGVIDSAHRAFLHATALYHQTPDFFFAHAGILPWRTAAQSAAEARADVLLWTREHVETQPEDVVWEKVVVCGHTPKPEPISRPHLIMLDTGAAYAHRPGMGRLCAVRLPERAFVFEPYAE